MAGVKISGLPSASALTGTESLPVVQSGVTSKGLVSQIGTYVRGLFTTTPATLAEGGTGAANAASARSNLGAAASGANTDITSLNAPALGGATATTQATGDSSTKVATTAFVAASATGHGQCQLQYVGTTSIKLVPWNGNFLKINGAVCTVPDAGVTLANTGLTANTKYYIYATASAGVINALEASTTAYATSTTAGNKGVVIKTADDTRTLVGMVYMNSGTPGTFGNSATWQGVRSWFNDPGVVATSGLASGKTTSSTTMAKLDSTTDITVATWAGESVRVWFNASHSNANNCNKLCSVLIDASTYPDMQQADNGFGAGTTSQAGSIDLNSLTEGAHTMSLIAAVDASSTTYNGAAAPSNSTPVFRSTFGVSAKGINP